MDEPAAWRDLATRFQELWNTDLHRGPLYASWSSVPFNDRGERWHVAGGQSDLLTEAFLMAAERAGVILGSPAGRPALFLWLDLLRAESRRYRGGGSLTTVADGVSTTAEIGTIHSVCLASRDQCYKLETKAIAARMVPAAPVSAQPLPEAQETVAQQIERLRVECDWKLETLAEMADISARTAQRHISGVTIPFARLLGRYERVFSKKLKRQVVIKKLS